MPEKNVEYGAMSDIAPKEEHVATCWDSYIHICMYSPQRVAVAATKNDLGHNVIQFANANRTRSARML